MSRKEPNIIITGTPGVGKTSHGELLAQETGLAHLAINDFVKQNNCHESWDEERQCHVVDDDKLLDALEDVLAPGGFIIDWHACDLFPESWIDLVVVLRTQSAEIYDRLKARHYADKKLQENLDAEIMGVLLEEAKEAFDEAVVIELESNKDDDIEGNVDRIKQWVQDWTRQHQD